MKRPAPSSVASSDEEEIDYSVKPEFYDPKIDEKDEAWVGKQRRGNRRSDAVLSCPACFTTLCLQSQRHETNVSQYRAMFVVNCKVSSDDMQVEQPGDDVGGCSVRQVVSCSVCSVEVGVLDEEEVYHFFDVIPSES
ncbi:E2F-associated phosphoprotein [Linum grandiflorum]